MSGTPMKIIEVIVSPKGETKIETQGFTGPSCREASRFLEQAIGRSTGERQTAAFFQTSAACHDQTSQRN